MDNSFDSERDEHRELEEALRMHAERLKILHELDQAISTSLRPTDIYHAFTRHAVRLLAFDYLSIALNEGDRMRVIYVASEAEANAGQMVDITVPRQASAMGWVAGRGQPLLRHNIAADVRFAEDEHLVAIGIRSSMLLPLRVKRQVIGIWNIGSQQIGVYNPDDLDLAQTMADQLAVAIQNARLYQETRQQAKELSVLNMVSQAITASLNLEEILTLIAEHTTQLLKAAAASVALYDGNTKDLWFAITSGGNADYVRGRRLSLGQGIVGWVVEHGEPLLIADAQQDARFFAEFDQQSDFITASVLCVPLEVKGQIIGAIEVMNKMNGSFSQQDLSFLSLLAKPAAIAIENAWLYLQAQQEITERRQAETALESSHQQLEAAYQQTKVYAEDLKEEVIERKQAEAALRRAHDELELRVEERTVELSKANAQLLQEVAERQQAEAALRESEERYALAARGANDGLWDWNLDTGEIYFSPRWKAMLGYDESEIRGHVEEWFKRVHPEDFEQLEADINAHQQGMTPHFQNEHRIQHKDGSFRWMLCRGLAVRNPDGMAYRIAGSQTNITQRKRSEEKLVHDAFHDPLTKLPNRALFMNQLDRAIEWAKQDQDYYFAVLFLDLDRFKVINDSLGHLVGDQLLQIIADRLRECVRPTDIVARFGGDEFTVLLDDIKELSTAEQVADRIQKEVAKPVYLGGQAVFPTTSIGITLGSAKYERPEDLLRDADTAMYGAKAKGRAHNKLFDTAQHTQAVTRLRVEGDLWQALDRREFQVYYQPIVSLISDQIVGVEALLRWQHPQLGLIKPRDFIPLAEETGLIVSIGDWVLRTACTQVKTWQDSGYTPLRLAVNVSARQFEQEHLLESIKALLKQIKLSAQSLELEIVEQTAMTDVPMILETLDKLKAMGVQISVDDFGVGSSLGLLNHLPFNTLKIDQSFIRGLQPDEAPIVSAIISLAHGLKLKVIAEGVETKDQLTFLRMQRCDEIQGYLFSPPLPSKELAQLLEHGPHLALD